MTFLITFLVTLYTFKEGMSKKGAYHGFWMGWIFSMVLVPAWMIKWMGPLCFDPRMGAALAGLACLVMKGEKVSLRKPVLMDFGLLGFFFSVLISQQLNGELSGGTISGFIRSWVIPYLVGRLLLSRHSQIRELVPYFALFLLVCSLLAIVEAVVQKNLVNLVFGKSFYILDNTSEGFRWGLKRAHGNTEHPIYFGLLLIMLFPWAIEAGRLALAKQGPKWWLIVPPSMFAAIIVTVSRGAQIGSVICMAIAVFFRFPKLRIIMIVFAVVLGLGKDAIKEKAMEVLSKAAGEEQHEEKWVPINGEEYLYTGTRHRMLLFIAYERGIEQAGWFGYGRTMKTVPVYEDARQRFSSIDCHYLVLLLSHGWAGIYTFCMMLGLSVLYAAKAAWNPKSWSSPITGPMCGSMLAVGVLLGSVFFHPHFGAVWMYTCGFLACVHAMPREESRDQQVEENAGNHVSLPQKPLPTPNRLRPVPAHAPIRPPA